VRVCCDWPDCNRLHTRKCAWKDDYWRFLCCAESLCQNKVCDEHSKCYEHRNEVRIGEGIVFLLLTLLGPIAGACPIGYYAFCGYCKNKGRDGTRECNTRNNLQTILWILSFAGACTLIPIGFVHHIQWLWILGIILGIYSVGCVVWVWLNVCCCGMMNPVEGEGRW
jgi:hypothetical protein